MNKYVSIGMRVPKPRMFTYANDLERLRRLMNGFVTPDWLNIRIK